MSTVVYISPCCAPLPCTVGVDRDMYGERSGQQEQLMCANIHSVSLHPSHIYGGWGGGSHMLSGWRLNIYTAEGGEGRGQRIRYNWMKMKINTCSVADPDPKRIQIMWSNPNLDADIPIAYGYLSRSFYRWKKWIMKFLKTPKNCHFRYR